MPSQWERFKQSNIAKIVIGYSLVVWVLIQLIEAVLPTFETPLWVAQTLTFLLILGFPIALLVGWAYEKLPARSTDADGVESVPQSAHSTPKKTLVLVGIGSCAVIGLFGFYMMPFIFDSSSFDKTDLASEVMPSAPIAVPQYRGMRASILLGESEVRNGFLTRTDLDISPDGNFLVYLVHNPSDATSEVLLRDLRYQDNVRTLGRVRWQSGSGRPKFSPDGEWIYIQDGGTIKRVRIEGGAMQAVPGTEDAGGWRFSLRGEEVFFSKRGDIKPYAAKADTGMGVPERFGADQELNIMVDDFLPVNGKALATVCPPTATNFSSCSVAILSNDPAEDEKLLLRTAYNARYASSGHIVFIRDASLWAVPFNQETLELVGPQVPVIQNIETSSRWGHAAYAFSNTGRLVFLSGGDVIQDAGRIDISRVDRAGIAEPLPLPTGLYGNLALSPDGKLLALTKYEGTNSDIWVWDLDQEIFGRLTFGANSAMPLWSKDGASIIYSQTTTPFGIMEVASNGTGQPELIASTEERVFPETISPDGAVLYSMGGPRKLYSTAVISDRISQLIDIGPDSIRSSQLSPDGNWLAYASLETGDWEVFVRPWPNYESGKWQASRAGGGQPLWSDNSNELFFWSGSGIQWSSEYTVNQDQDGNMVSIRFLEPKEIFARQQPRGDNINPGWAYSSTADDFLMIALGGESNADAEQMLLDEQTIITVVEDWFAELSAMAPAQTY